MKTTKDEVPAPGGTVQYSYYRLHYRVFGYFFRVFLLFPFAFIICEGNLTLLYSSSIVCPVGGEPFLDGVSCIFFVCFTCCVASSPGSATISRALLGMSSPASPESIRCGQNLG